MSRLHFRLSSSTACLILVLLLYVAVWISCPQEFIASDPWAYSQLAFSISRDFSFGISDVFNHRLGITVPVAAIYSLFGVGIITTNLWPLVAALLVVMTVWSALPDDKSKIVGAILCLVSVPLFNSSTALFPDIVAAAFMASSSLLLFRRQALIQDTRTRLLAPLAATILLFLAFLAKESAYWVLPLWAMAVSSDMKEATWKMMLRRFYLPCLGAGVILGIMYLVFCQATWGDPLARFKSIQAFTGHHLWSWDKTPIRDLVYRLTISPVRLLLALYGSIVLLLAVIGVFIAPRSLKPWGYYAGFCLLLYWFGSTSFSRYEPLPLMDRMTLPMLPAFYILAAFTISRLSVVVERTTPINTLFPVLFVVGLAGLPFAKEVNARWRNPLSETTAMSFVIREVERHPEKTYLLVSSDYRSPTSLSFHFGYQYPPNLHVAWVEDLREERLRSDVRYVFLDRRRSEFLRTAYGLRHYDAEIDSLGLSAVYKSGGVELLISERQYELRRLCRVNTPGDSRAK